MQREFHFPFLVCAGRPGPHKWLPALALSLSCDIEKATIYDDNINLIKRLAEEKKGKRKNRNQGVVHVCVCC